MPHALDAGLVHQHLVAELDAAVADEVVVDLVPAVADDELALLVAERAPGALEHARHRLGVLPLGVGERAVEIEEDRAQHYFAQSPVRCATVC